MRLADMQGIYLLFVESTQRAQPSTLDSSSLTETHDLVKG
jgi:hypothetical protein